MAARFDSGGVRLDIQPVESPPVWQWEILQRSLRTRRVKHLFEEVANRRLIATSGLFDTSWYLAHSADVAEAKLDPILHYLRDGWRENRDPYWEFETAFYRKRYLGDLQDSLCPLVHYIEVGRQKGFQTISPNHPLMEGSSQLSESPISDKDYKLRVGVVIHAFYEELLAELLTYCKSIPGAPRIYVGVCRPEVVERAKRLVRRYLPNSYFSVKVTKNVGRNVATLTALFGPILLDECDVICHLHTKKSAYAFGEQVDWRHSLLKNLLLDDDYVRRVLTMFEEDASLGIVSPSPFYRLAYWAMSVLSNREPIETLCKTIEMPLPPFDYTYFPAGCMFWGRTAAIRQLLDGRITYEDYPPEEGQIDGTLQHAIERSICLLAKHNGFGFAEVNARAGRFFKDFGSANFYQYNLECSSLRLELLLETRIIVSFSLFDTLVAKTREASDNRLVPRIRVIELLHTIKGMGKRVILVADTSLDREHVIGILNSIGCNCFDEIYLSCDEGLSKSDGSLWEHVVRKEQPTDTTFLHIGDDENADVKQLMDRDLASFHVLSPRNLYGLHSRTLFDPEAALEARSRSIAEQYNDPLEGR
jgi:hypothetical protein